MSHAEAAGASQQNRQAIIGKARSLGFHAIGFAPAQLADDHRRGLAAYVAQGRHGFMQWMADTFERRVDPRALWPQARTVISLGMNYASGLDPMARLRQMDEGVISVYALNVDYHELVKKKAKALARWMADPNSLQEPDKASGSTYGMKVFVDTAPVMEKPLAQAAGLGWAGKHTNLVSRNYGSWLFLAEVLTDLELPYDEAESDHCGSCTQCIDICPTKAIDAAGRIDARRCISYLTIEHEGAIEADLRSLMGNRIYGCDDCSAICPWNRFAVPTDQPELQPRPELIAPKLVDLLALDEQGFRELFRKSPVKRIGHKRFLRNVLIAAGNALRSAASSTSAEKVALRQAIATFCQHPDEVLRQTAEWAQNT